MVIIISCVNTKNRNGIKNPEIDYSNKTVLDSIIEVTPYSKDTIFLGFKIGMSKKDFRNHIHKLRNDGKRFDYSDSNLLSTFGQTINLGSGYTFINNISAEKSGKTITGKGKYFLHPIYSVGGGLTKLTIIPTEEWNGNFYFDKPKWLENKIIDNTDRIKDESLRQALIDMEFTDNYHFVRQKGNIIIYETKYTINYIDLKTLLLEFLSKEIKKDIIKEENKDIKF